MGGGGLMQNKDEVTVNLKAEHGVRLTDMAWQHADENMPIMPEPLLPGSLPLACTVATGLVIQAREVSYKEASTTAPSPVSWRR